MKSKLVDPGLARRDFLSRAGTALVGASLGKGFQQSHGAEIDRSNQAGKAALNSSQTEGKYYQATVPDTLDLAATCPRFCTNGSE